MGNCYRKKRTRVDETAYRPKSQAKSTFKPLVTGTQQTYQSAVSLCQDVPVVPSGAWPTATNGKPEESLQLETPPVIYNDVKEFVHSEGGSSPQLNTPITDEDTSVQSDGASSPQLNSALNYSDKEGSKPDSSSSSLLSGPVRYSDEEGSKPESSSSSLLSSPVRYSDEEGSKSDSSSSSQLKSHASYSDEEESFQLETSQLSTTATYSFEDKYVQSDGATCSDLDSSEIFSDGEVTFPLLTLQQKPQVTYSNEDTSVGSDGATSLDLDSSEIFSDGEVTFPLLTLQQKPRVNYSNEDTSVRSDSSSSSQLKSHVIYSDEEESFQLETATSSFEDKAIQSDGARSSELNSSEIFSMNVSVGPYNLYSLKGDLQYVMEYGNENYAYKRNIELYFVPDNCLSHTELDEEDRRKMVLSLIKSHSKHSLSLESLCLAINYLDRLLLNLTVDRSTYNVMAITAMVLALKISERGTQQLHQLIQSFRTYYTNTTMWTMEAMLMSKLEYRLIAPTTNFFLEHLIMKRMATAAFTAQTVEENYMLMGCAKAVVKLCMTEYYYCSIPPSLQAICCVKAAEWVLSPDKTVTITGVQGYPNESVQEVLEYTITLIKDNHDYFSSLTEFEHIFLYY
ncbi:uncharacterized protein LOC120917113 [Rana temporaria]|uniref:uncharacterized protein LOC120917113 n=1 Tax=Rana temporaria TaxID=8407 RepID=UPI001AAD422A|nr:uncharacterized protein LOC120917113 [Rana temporaria]